LTIDPPSEAISRASRQGRAENATINRELSIVNRAFRLALQAGKLLYLSHVPMLREDNVRIGFFKRHEFEAVSCSTSIA